MSVQVCSGERRRMRPVPHKAGVSDLHHLVMPSAGIRTEQNIGARYLERTTARRCTAPTPSRSRCC